MKFAKVDKGLSISGGGRTIEAINADWDTYLKEKVVCPYCYSPVYLRAKNSQYREPHWVHFPGYGMGCVAKSNPKLITIKQNKNLENEFKGQCAALFKEHLTKILYYAYSQEGYDRLVKEYGNNWVSTIIKKAEIYYNQTFPEYPLTSWLKKIANLLKNTTTTCTIIETFFEEVLTNPDFIKEAISLGATRINNWDDSFFNKLITEFPYNEMLTHRAILIELMKFFGNSENIDVFCKWLQLNLLQLSYFYNLKPDEKVVTLELFKKYGPEKILLLYSIANLTLIDWQTAFNLLRQGKPPEVYVISYGTINSLLDYLFLCNQWTPIKLASDKGFGKK